MREYVRLQTGILLRHLAAQAKHAAHEDDAEAIHDVRVAIRRLSRCLRLFSQFYPGGSWKKLRRRLSGLMNACGNVRDHDIALELLKEAGVPATNPLMAELDEARRAAHKKLRRELERWDEERVNRRWHARLEL